MKNFAHGLLLTATLSVYVFVLSACATEPRTIAPPADNDRKVHIDERLMQECVPPTDIAPNPQPSDVLEQHKKDVIAFKECADGKRDLISVIRKAFE